LSLGTTRNAGRPYASSLVISSSFSAIALKTTSRDPFRRTTVMRRGRLIIGMRISPVTVRMFWSISESFPCGRTFHC
jgi:hypothetical protein